MLLSPRKPTYTLVAAWGMRRHTWQGRLPVAASCPHPGHAMAIAAPRMPAPVGSTAAGGSPKSSV